MRKKWVVALGLVAPEVAWAGEAPPADPPPSAVEETAAAVPRTPWLGPFAITLEQGVFVGTGKTTERIPCTGRYCQDTHDVRDVGARGQGTSLGVQLQVSPHALASVRGSFGTAQLTGGTATGGPPNGTGGTATGGPPNGTGGTAIGGTTYAYAGQIGAALDFNTIGFGLGFVGGTHFGSSAETRSSFGPEFHLRLGGARPTEVDAPDDSSFSHGAFAVSFGATHPEQVALGRQVRMGWLYRRWGGELDAAVLAQNVRGTWSGGMDLHFVVPVPIRPGLLMEIPFGVACAPSLSPGESYYGFHAGLRVRVGR